MNKLKTALNEQKFLQESSLEDVGDYILKHSFKYSSEVMFITLFPELVGLYISRYGLSQKSAKSLIESADWNNINCLIKSKPKNYSVEALFLEHGEYKQVVNWLKDNDCAKYPEKELFWSNRINEIVDFVRKHKVSAFGQKDLIMRKHPEVIKSLILSGKLNNENRILAAKCADANNVWLLVQVSDGKKDLEVLEQICKVRFSKNLKKLVRSRLTREAENLFLEIAPFEMVVLYAQNCGLVEIAEKLLDRPKEDGIIKFLSKNKLSTKCELKLFDRGCHLEIKAYIKTHELSVEGEVRLIKRGYHREIMLYLKKHSLADEGQVELIKRGNYLEIMELVSKYQLAEKAVECLLKRGIKEEIDAWTENILPEAK